MMDNGLKFKDIFKKKSFYIFSFILVFSVALSVWLNLREGIYVGKNFLYKVNDNYYKFNNNSLRITTDGEKFDYRLVIDGKKISATIKWVGKAPSGKVLIVINSGNSSTDNMAFGGYINKDGELVNGQGNPIYVSDSSDSDSINNSDSPISNEELAQCLCDLSYNLKTKTRGNIIYIVIYILFYIICMFHFYLPKGLYFIKRKSIQKSSVSSNMGIMVNKIVCFIAMVISLIAMVAPFR